MDTRITIRGVAQGSAATLDVSGDTLTWRSRSEGAADNVATTIHEIRDVLWLERRWSGAGLALLVLGGAALAVASAAVLAVAGALAMAAGLTVSMRRLTRPTRRLALACGDRRLVLDVDGASAADARALAARIRGVLHSGDLPSIPPTLP